MLLWPRRSGRGSPTTPLPVTIDPPVYSARLVELREITVAFERIKRGGDATPVFQGLPDDRCPCSHWGLVVSGEIHKRPSSEALQPVGQLEIAYDEVGSGSPAVVLIHGALPTAATTRRREHGGSETPSGSFGIVDAAADVIAVCDAAGVTGAILVGHSWAVPLQSR